MAFFRSNLETVKFLYSKSGTWEEIVLEIQTTKLSESELDGISGGLSNSERQRIQMKILQLQMKRIDAARLNKEAVVESIDRQLRSLFGKLFG